jgi:hypothetical protein
LASLETATTGTPLATWTFAQVAFPELTYPVSVSSETVGEVTTNFVSVISHNFLAPTQNPTTGVAGYARVWVWQWVTGKAIAAGSYCFNAGNLYYTAAGGTTGAAAPTVTSGSVSDGTVTWTFVQTANNGASGHAISDHTVNTSEADIVVGTTQFENGAGVTITTHTLNMPIS